MRYKCARCSIAFDSESLVAPLCPICDASDQTIEMCPKDHCECHHEVVDGIAYCDLCGEACCPICGSHDVAQISRVTGYLQDVEGWNAGKRQELKDRTRYDVS